MDSIHRIRNFFTNTPCKIYTSLSFLGIAIILIASAPSCPNTNHTVLSSYVAPLTVFYLGYLAGSQPESSATGAARHGTNQSVRTTTHESLESNSSDYLFGSNDSVGDPKQQLDTSPPKVEDQQIELPDDVPDQQIESPDDVPDQQIESPDDVPDQQIESPDDVPDQQIESPDDVPDQQIESPDDVPDQQIESPDDVPDQQIESPPDVPDQHIASPPNAEDQQVGRTRPEMKRLREFTQQVGT